MPETFQGLPCKLARPRSKRARDFDNNPKIYLRQFGADLHRYQFLRTNKFPGASLDATTGMTFMEKAHCQFDGVNCRQSLKQFPVSNFKKSLMRVMAIVCEVCVAKQRDRFWSVFGTKNLPAKPQSI